MAETYAGDFQVFIKPVGPLCNLSCSYCYYLDKTAFFREPLSLMSDAVLEALIKGLIEATKGKYVNFSWHGGEPMLAGLPFFKKALSLQKKYCTVDKVIRNSIQTNATLIDEEWCAFFAEEGFSVGISLDGPSRFHDKYRLSGSGSSTFDRVMRGFDLLCMHDLVPEILCVVSAANAAAPHEVYGFLRKLGAEFITFILLVEPDFASGTFPSSVPALEFGKFLATIFDMWVENDIGKIKIQIIEETLRTAFGQEHSLCILRPICGTVPVVEHNGDIYACDHYVEEGYYLGNVTGLPLNHAIGSRELAGFGNRKRDSLPAACLSCEFLDMCNGECPKNRIKSTDGQSGQSYLCEGYKYFFRHIKPFAETVAQEWQAAKGRHT